MTAAGQNYWPPAGNSMAVTGQSLLAADSLADRHALTVHPRGDRTRSTVGVFATRSPSRPNPIGLHLARITSITTDGGIEVVALEAVDGTPVLDVKPALGTPETR